MDAQTPGMRYVSVIQFVRQDPRVMFSFDRLDIDEFKFEAWLG